MTAGQPTTEDNRPANLTFLPPRRQAAQTGTDPVTSRRWRSSRGGSARLRQNRSRPSGRRPKAPLARDLPLLRTEPRGDRRARLLQRADLSRRFGPAGGAGAGRLGGRGPAPDVREPSEGASVACDGQGILVARPARSAREGVLAPSDARTVQTHSCCGAVCCERPQAERGECWRFMRRHQPSYRSVLCAESRCCICAERERVARGGLAGAVLNAACAGLCSRA